MKRIIILLTILSMLLCGCGDKSGDSTEQIAEHPSNVYSYDVLYDIENDMHASYFFGNKFKLELTGDIFEMYLSEDGTLTIPSKIDDYTNTISVSSGLTHEQRLKVKSIVIEEGVEYIFGGAFQDLKNLKTVTLPSTIRGIGSNAFEMCSSLERINIPESVEFIGIFAFFGCAKLKELPYPQHVKAVCENSFYYCECLEWAECPDKDSFNINSIGVDVGYKKVPASVNAIAEEGFSGNDLYEIFIENGVGIIGDRAFYNCSNLHRIIIPPSVTYIGEDTFTGCSDELVIYGEFGSYAEQWANEHGITFGLYVF